MKAALEELEECKAADEQSQGETATKTKKRSACEAFEEKMTVVDALRKRLKQDMAAEKEEQ